MKALKKYFPLISLICGALALVMIFLPAGEYGPKDYSGFQVAFGDKEEMLDFSILNMLSFLFGAIGGALAFLGAKKGNNMMKYAAIVCFVVGAILLFCGANFVQFDGIPSSFEKEIRKEIDLAIGSIFGGIFCLVGAASTAGDVFIKE